MWVRLSELERDAYINHGAEAADAVSLLPGSRVWVTPPFPRPAQAAAAAPTKRDEDAPVHS